MTWHCFGWVGNFCHTGSGYFTSEGDGMCIEDHDQDYDPQTYPFKIYFVVVNQPDISRLGRKLIAYFNGVEYYRSSMNNSWNWAEIHSTIEGAHNNARYKFELQDGNDKVLCTRYLLIGEQKEEPIVIDEPEFAEIDYDRIVEGNALIVSTAREALESEINENQTGISGLGDKVDSATEGLTTGISGVSFTVTDEAGSIKGLIREQIGGITQTLADGIGGLTDRIDGIQFPTLEGIKSAFLDTCGDLASALWDAILDRIEERYPKDNEESD